MFTVLAFFVSLLFLSQLLGLAVDASWKHLGLIFQDMFNPATVVQRTAVGFGFGFIHGLASGVDKWLEAAWGDVLRAGRDSLRDLFRF